MMWTERMIDVDTVQLRCAVGPAAGPPLLLLHGVTRRWQDFVTVAPLLASRWHVHALDQRGHGGSSRCPGQYHVIDYAHDVTRFLQTETDEPVVVFGHSLGALVALAVAAAEPSRVRALVLGDPPAFRLVQAIDRTPFFALFTGLRGLASDPRSVSDVAREMAELRFPAPSGTVRFGDLRDATALRFTARCLRELDPDVLTPLLAGRWLDGYDIERVLGGVRCPVLLLRADENAGGMLPVTDASQLIELLSDATRIDLPGVGHLLHWLEPEQTIRYVVGFLESLR